MRIEPGDLIVADYDGVATVPRGMAEKTLRQCEELVKTENKVRDAVRQGIPPLEAYDQFGKF